MAGAEIRKRPRSLQIARARSATRSVVGENFIKLREILGKIILRTSPYLTQMNKDFQLKIRTQKLLVDPTISTSNNRTQIPDNNYD